MGKRTNGQERDPQIVVSPAVHAQLTAYKEALERDCNRKASFGDIIGSLLWGVPVWQAEAMFREHRPQCEDSTDTESEDDDGE